MAKLDYKNSLQYLVKVVINHVSVTSASCRAIDGSKQINVKSIREHIETGPVTQTHQCLYSAWTEAIAQMGYQDATT